MAEIKIYKEGRQAKEEERKFSDELDVRRYSSDVQDRIQKEISADFVLASLNENQKEAIPKLYGLAIYAKEALERAKERTKIEWNQKKKEWYKRELTEEEAKKIQASANRTYDALMNRLKLVAILERNKDENALLTMLLTQEKLKQAIGIDKTKEEIKGKIEKE